MVNDKSPAVETQGQSKKSGLYYGYVIVICAFIILIITFGTNYSFGIFFNRLLDDLGWSRAVTSTGYSIATLIAGIAGIVAGRLSDRFGPKVSVLVCGIGLVIGCLLMSQVTQTWQLYIFYGIFVGLGFGGSSIALSSTVARWFVKNRGLINGIAVSGIGTGTVVMPLLANFLLTNYDWRQSFVLIGLLALVVVIPASFFLKRDPSKIGQRAYGEEQSVSNNTSSKESGLTFRESVRTRQFWTLCVIYVFYGFFVQSIMVHIVPHAKSMGIDAGSAALIMSFLGIGSLTGRIVMGSVSDRIGVKNTLAVALGLILATFIWLMGAESLWMLYVFALVYGFGYGALISMQALAPANMFGLISLGTLVGVTTCAYTSGGALGPILTGYIFDVTGSYFLAFIVFSALAAAGLVLTLTLKPPVRKKDG